MGVATSDNWLPLIFPLVAIVVLLKGGEILARLIKKRRLVRENQLINDLTATFENSIGQPKDPE